MTLSLHRHFDTFISLIIPFLCHEGLFGLFVYVNEGVSDIS